MTPEQAGAATTAAVGGEVEVLDSRRLGGAWTLDRLWERLGIGAAIRRAAAGRRLDGESVERVVFALVAQRACEPGSTLAATTWVAQRVAIEGCPGSPTIRRTGRWTSCSTRWARSPRRSSPRSRTCSTSISTSCSWILRLLGNRDRRHAELAEEPTDDELSSPAEAETRTFGHSKDHRGDLPQVVIAMAVTRDGVPVRCWTFPGNTADTAIIRTIQDDLGGWGLRPLVWVADRGFASAANRAYLTRGGGHYIHAEKLRHTNTEAAAALAATTPSRTTCKSPRSTSPPAGTATARTGPAPSDS